MNTLQFKPFAFMNTYFLLFRLWTKRFGKRVPDIQCTYAYTYSNADTYNVKQAHNNGLK